MFLIQFLEFGFQIFCKILGADVAPSQSIMKENPKKETKSSSKVANKCGSVNGDFSWNVPDAK